MIREYVGYKSYAGKYKDEILYNMGISEEPIIRCGDCDYCKQNTGRDKELKPYKCKHFNVLMSDTNGFCYWAKNTDGSCSDVGSAQIIPVPSDSDFTDDWKWKCDYCNAIVQIDEVEQSEDGEVPKIIRHANYCQNCGKQLYK